MPEFIDLVFAKTNPNRSFLIIENERFGIVFANTRIINSGILNDAMGPSQFKNSVPALSQNAVFTGIN